MAFILKGAEFKKANVRAARCAGRRLISDPAARRIERRPAGSNHCPNIGQWMAQRNIYFALHKILVVRL
jgi:hypothetical protein